MAKNIVQLNIDGTSYTTRPYVVCNPVGNSESGKLYISVNELSVTSGTTLLIRFSNPVGGSISDEDASGVWFHINNVSYNVSYNGSPCNPSFFKSGIIYEFYYDGSEWKLIGQYFDESRLDLLEQQVGVLKTILSQITDYNFSSFDTLVTTTAEESNN